MDLTNSAIKIFVDKVVGTVLSIIGLVFFARFLTPTQLGSYFLFHALLELLAIPANIGLKGAAEKRISEGRNEEDILSTVISMKTGLIFVVSFSILIFRNYINSYVGDEIYIHLIILLVIYEFSELGIHVLKGELRVGEIASIRIIRRFFWISLGILLVVQGYGFIGIIYALIISYILQFSMTWYKINLRIGSLRVEQAISLFRYSKFHAISGVGARIFNWMDIIVIGYFLSQTFVSGYEIGWRISALTLISVQSVRTTIFPQISAWAMSNEIAKIEALVSNAFVPAYIIIIPSFFGSLLLSEELITIIFGPEYSFAWIVLILFIIQRLVQATNDVIGRTLQALDYPNLAAYATIIGVIANLGLNLWLVWTYGIIGAAIATVVSSLVMTLLRFRYLSSIISISIPKKKIGWMVFSSLAMLIILFPIETYYDIKTLDSLVVILLTGVIIYSIFILMFGPIRSDINNLLKDYVLSVL